MSRPVRNPRLRSELEHQAEIIGNIVQLLRYAGLPVPDDIPPLPGESAMALRLRRLEALQPYSREWEKHRLERLPDDRLDVAEHQIIEAAYHHAMDIICEVEQLHLVGHDAAFISRVTGVSLDRVLRFTASPNPRSN